MPQSYQDDEDEDKEEDLRERAKVKVEDRVVRTVGWERGDSLERVDDRSSRILGDGVHHQEDCGSQETHSRQRG